MFRSSFVRGEQIAPFRPILPLPRKSGLFLVNDEAFSRLPSLPARHWWILSSISGYSNLCFHTRNPDFLPIFYSLPLWDRIVAYLTSFHFASSCIVIEKILSPYLLLVISKIIEIDFVVKITLYSATQGCHLGKMKSLIDKTWRARKIDRISTPEEMNVKGMWTDIDI